VPEEGEPGGYEDYRSEAEASCAEVVEDLVQASDLGFAEG
jgi:hypothetical protein